MGKSAKIPIPCPCGGAEHDRCCGRYLDADVPAPDAESLMRSRYCAYVLEREPYLLATWHGSTRPTSPLLEPGIKWLGLEVKRHERWQEERPLQQERTERAIVEFVARYRVQGRAQRLHEESRFVRENGRWFYVDGSFPA